MVPNKHARGFLDFANLTCSFCVEQRSPQARCVQHLVLKGWRPKTPGLLLCQNSPDAVGVVHQRFTTMKICVEGEFKIPRRAGSSS